MEFENWRQMMLRKFHNEETFSAFRSNHNFVSWLAGFIDGEGNFYMHYTPKIGLICMLSICNTDEKTIKEVFKNLGVGSLYVQRNRNASYKPLFKIQINRQKELMPFLSLVIPHLRVKRKEAERMYSFLIK